MADEENDFIGRVPGWVWVGLKTLIVTALRTKVIMHLVKHKDLNPTFVPEEGISQIPPAARSSRAEIQARQGGDNLKVPK